MNTSAKFWNSLYNNFHPGKRNPSISSALIILLCFFLLCQSNKPQKQLPVEESMNNILLQDIQTAKQDISMLLMPDSK